jgi:hypothetical protein
MVPDVGTDRTGIGNVKRDNILAAMKVGKETFMVKIEEGTPERAAELPH